MNRAHPACRTLPEILVSAACPRGHLAKCPPRRNKSNNCLKCNAIFEAPHDRCISSRDLALAGQRDDPRLAQHYQPDAGCDMVDHQVTGRRYSQ
jgi:hypothetical protein